MRSFHQAAKSAVERIDSQELSADERAKMQEALHHHAGMSAGSHVWRWRLLASGSVAAALIAAGVYLTRPARVSTDFAVVAGKDCVRSIELGVEVTADCVSTPRLALDGAEATLSPGSVLVREETELRVRRGRVAFTVAKRQPRRPPFLVRVSAGAVVVAGTRFTIVEQGQSGSLEVTEGAVEFRWADGKKRDVVAAGSVLRWPSSPLGSPESAPEALAPAPTVKTELHAKSRAPEPRLDPYRTMQQLLQLRTQNRLDEGIALLRAASQNSGYTAVQRERFGFELCNLVGQAQDEEAACSCWRTHARQFPGNPHKGHLEKILHDCR